MAFEPSADFYARQQSLSEVTVAPRMRKRCYVPPRNTIVPKVDLPPTVPAEEPVEEPAEVPAPPQEETFNLSADEMQEFHIKPKAQSKPRPVRNTENFVKLNLKKGRSFAKMGRCRGSAFARRKLRMFQRAEEEAQMRCFSKGYYEERTPTVMSLDERLRTEFHFDAWEPQQKESIESVLAGNSTLVLLPTGAGKSLIYQMCARVMGGLTVVVFPLVSLIADQLEHIPSCLAAGCIHSSQPFTDTLQVIKAARQGKLDILLTTPEKLSFFLAVPLPSVRLLCVDEAHCVSEWSHAFRAAYYETVVFLNRHSLGLTLALTATATTRTVTDITEKLKVTRTFQCAVRFRDNIKVTCSREVDSISAASALILSRELKEGSVLVFAAYQSQAQSLCDWLRSQGVRAKCYHGRMTENEKYQIQASFNSGETRVLVSTLAFGMGIDKADIRGVVHLTLPKSIEQFIQESGRAGRDGTESWAHVFVQKSQYYVFQSYLISEHVTASIVQRFIRSFSPPQDSEKHAKRVSGGAEPLGLACVEVQEACDSLGLERDTVRMLLALLERRGILTYTATSLSFLHGVVSFHRRPAEDVAKDYAAISHILAVGKCCGGRWNFSVPEVSARLGVYPPELVQVLKRLEGTRDISLDLSKEIYCFTQHKGCDDDHLPKIANEIANCCTEIISMEIYKLQNVYHMLQTNSFNSHSAASDVRRAVSTFIDEYYEDESVKLWPGIPIPAEVYDDCSEVMGNFEFPPDEKDLACVLMGVRTKKISAELWRSHKAWGKYAECNFIEVLQQVQLFLHNELPPTDAKRLRTA